jgi:hypothetical protein
MFAPAASSTVIDEGVNTALFYGIVLRGALPQQFLLRGMLMGWAALPGVLPWGSGGVRILGLLDCQ